MLSDMENTLERPDITLDKYLRLRAEAKLLCEMIEDEEGTRPFAKEELVAIVAQKRVVRGLLG